MTRKSQAIRPGTLGDVDQVLSLNQEEAKWTSDLSLDTLRELIDFAEVFNVLVTDDVVSGFILVMNSTSPYPNANLNWFRDRISNFWYVDRIVVARKHAGSGGG